MQTLLSSEILADVDSSLQNLQDLTQLVQQLIEDVDQLSASSESQFHDLNNQVRQTHQQIRDLKVSLPDPPPVIEDWSDPPPLQIKSPIQPFVPNPELEPSDVSAALVQQIAHLIEEQQRLPARLERGVRASLFSSLDVQRWMVIGITGIAFHALVTTLLVIITLHWFPPPLHPMNEAQLFQIYKTILKP